MATRWHVEAFEFESRPSLRTGEGLGSDGPLEGQEGQQEFWTGTAWISLPPHAFVTKVPKFVDGYYLNTPGGDLLRRMATFWYYWSRPHADWRWLEGVNDGSFKQNEMKRLGSLNENI